MHSIPPLRSIPQHCFAIVLPFMFKPVHIDGRRMISLQHTSILAMLVGTLALGMHPPAKAQRTGADNTTSQIEGMALARVSAANTATAQAFDTALQEYERCHWLPAFEQLVRLADQGHSHAARMAMQMHQYGPALFGQAFALPPGEMERLARVRWQAQRASHRPAAQAPSVKP